MRTIAQKLKITVFPFEIKDSNNNEIYFENSDGYWCQYEFDENNNEIYSENSDGLIKDNRVKLIPESTMEERHLLMIKETLAKIEDPSKKEECCYSVMNKIQGKINYLNSLMVLWNYEVENIIGKQN